MISHCPILRPPTCFKTPKDLKLAICFFIALGETPKIRANCVALMLPFFLLTAKILSELFSEPFKVSGGRLN